MNEFIVFLKTRFQGSIPLCGIERRYMAVLSNSPETILVWEKLSALVRRY
jgi:hypothetical protein